MKCEHMYNDTSKRRAVCSVLRGELVCVRCVVHAIVHSGLNVVGDVHCSVALCIIKYVREFLVQDVLYLQDHQWQDHDWSEDSARSLKQSAQVPSEDQQDYQWKDRKW